MKKIIILLILVIASITLVAEDASEWINRAKKIEIEDIDGAIDIMSDAYGEYETNIDILSYYGLVLSKGAGEANMFRAAFLSSKAEKMLNKALILDPNHVASRLYRGILKVNVPKFLGKLNDGIEDLEQVVKTAGSDNEIYIVGGFYLGYAYEKAGKKDIAIEHFKNVVRYGTDSEYCSYAKKKLEKLNSESANSDEIDETDYVKQGDKYFSENEIVKAYKSYVKATEKDTTNIELYFKYLGTMRTISQDGYPDAVHDDVAFMSDLAFNVADAFRHIVRLDPKNEEYRLMKATTLLHLPFFVNCTQEGINEALWISKNGQNRGNVYQATQLVEMGQLKLKKRELTDRFVVSNDDKEKQKLITGMQTGNSEQEQPEGMSTIINIALGFGDYIAPQTAVWIENMKGEYIASVYVSGFSAKVKDKQVQLPKWAEKSKFEDSIVKVTGASIDSGNHTFYWNNRDSSGKQLMRGDYNVVAEVSHWPHSGYSLQKIKLSLGGKSYRQKIKGDNFITGMKVSY